MSWVTIGVAVGGAVVSGVQQNKAKKDAQSLQNQAAKAAGRIPDAAEYEEIDLVPVDMQDVQSRTLQGNYNMIGLINQLMGINSDITHKTSRTRANSLSPLLLENMGSTAALGSDYLAGNVPWSDAMETVARSTGLTGSVGTPGTGAALTARDLGMLDMDVRQRGVAMNQAAISQGEALDPGANYGNPQDWQIRPNEAVPWKINENLQLSSLAMKQAENVYTADQNANNLAAGMDPAAMARLSGQDAANKGVDWSQIINSLGSAYGTYQNRNGGLNTGGTYRTQGQAQSAAPYASGYTKNPQGGYSPVAEVVI